MNRTKRFDREEALRAEAEAYLRKLRTRLSEEEGLVRRAQMGRQEAAQKQAQTYLDLLNERASFRDAIRARIAKRWRNQCKVLSKRAEAYRKRLRRYLNPELLDEPTEFFIQSDLLGWGNRVVGFRKSPEEIVVLPVAASQTPADLLCKMQDIASHVAEELSGMILGQTTFAPVRAEDGKALNVHGQNTPGSACGSDAPAHS